MSRAVTTARILAGALAGASILLFVGVAVARLGYPYELEWVEGFFLGIVERVLDGEPIYVRPSLEFISCVYTPLYFLVAALPSALLGGGFAPLRLVSVASTLGCFALLYRLVRVEGGGREAGLLAAGLYAATFEAAGAWFDLARVDSLFLCLLLAGVLVLRAAETSIRLALAAGALLGLAFLAKQTALVIVVPVLLFHALSHGRRALAAAASLAGVVALSTLAMDLASDGWYRFYVFQFQPQRALLAHRALAFWTRDVAGTLPVAAAGTAALAWIRARGPGRRQALFPVVLIAAMVGASWLARSQEGGYHNNFMPAFAGLSLGMALAVGALGGSGAAEPRRLAVHLACALQLAVLAYDPTGQIPTQADRRAGDRVLELLEGTPGEVYIPNQGYLARAAGKASFAHGVMIWDVFRSDREELKAEIAAALETGLRDGRFARAIESEGWPTFPDLLARHYRLERRLFGGEDVFWPVTGAPPVRPEFVFVPRTGVPVPAVGLQ